jgi:hypothetical protein
MQETLHDRLVEIDQTITLSRKRIVEIGDQKRIRLCGAPFLATVFEKLKVGLDMRMEQPAMRAVVG